MARTPRASAQERAEWADDLRGQLPPGSTAYTVLRHVSRSGMLREIDVLAFDCEDGKVQKRWLSYRVAALLGRTLGDRDGIRETGAGMDMGFHLVYSLSRRLYADGFDCAGEHCPSNDHSNGMPRPMLADGRIADPTYWIAIGGGLNADLPHHADGGYAIRHEWL